MSKLHTIDPFQTVEVSPVTIDDAGRYQWTATYHDIDGVEYDGLGEWTVAFHTNRDGEGLWRDGRQVEGTCQFRLAGVSPSTRRRRVLAAVGVPAEVDR